MTRDHESLDIVQIGQNRRKLPGSKSPTNSPYSILRKQVVHKDSVSVGLLETAGGELYRHEHQSPEIGTAQEEPS